MNTLESCNQEKISQNDQQKESTKKDSFDIKKPHPSPEFYEVHKHIENLLAFLSKPKNQEEDTDSQKERMLSVSNKLKEFSLENGIIADKAYGDLALAQSNEADSLKEKITSDYFNVGKNKNLNKEILFLHIENSEKLKSIKERLENIYEKADSQLKESFVFVEKSLEQIARKANVFIVYTLLHENGVISESALDILLALEPSLIASAETPGIFKNELQKDSVGVILRKGNIESIVDSGDIINSNDIAITPKEIYNKLCNKNNETYHEIVVNNPEIFGFFLNVNVDENGNLYDFKTNIEEDAKRYKSNFIINMEFAKSRGLPQLVMTPDKRMFTFLSIEDNGLVHIGKEITPEDVIKSNLVMSPLQRMETRKAFVKNIV